jgi:phage tail sheath protein FI
MKGNLKTPGVYIQEKDAFGNAVVPVPTAIPAFIGYTEQTSHNGMNLINKAVKVTSLTEFNTVFGSKPPQIQFEINVATEAGQNTVKSDTDFTANGIGYTLATTTVNYRLHGAIRFFYANGGGTCYIVSTGAYDYTLSSLTSVTPFTNALNILEKETEPTIIVVPDAVELKDPSGTALKDKYALCYDLQEAIINHCGSLANRVTLLDIPGGYSEPLRGETSVEGFRTYVEPASPKFNSYAAAYYPWLHTTVYQLGDLTCAYISENSYDTVTTMLNKEFSSSKESSANQIKTYIAALFAPKPLADGITQEEADSVLKNLSSSYKLLLNCILEKVNLMPPGAAMAGIYTLVDNSRGVWVAPANVGVQSVVAPSINIDHETQEDLNVPIDGKSICAIRSFPGMGVLVWGARTLDGNSNDWRYINVRRTLIYIEQSIKDAARAYVFEANDAKTWVSVERMISNFLIGLWKQGGLAGPKPADAFSVSVGLGKTMTAEDILEGRMNVSVKVAVSRPAEFIVITFQQEMQKG